VVTKDDDLVRLLDPYGPPRQAVWVTCGNVRNAELRPVVLPAWPQAAALPAAGEPLVEIGWRSGSRLGYGWRSGVTRWRALGRAVAPRRVQTPGGSVSPRPTGRVYSAKGTLGYVHGPLTALPAAAVGGS
jgi:hypothetical protein